MSLEKRGKWEFWDDHGHCASQEILAGGPARFVASGLRVAPFLGAITTEWCAVSAKVPALPARHFVTVALTARYTALIDYRIRSAFRHRCTGKYPRYAQAFCGALGDAAARGGDLGSVLGTPLRGVALTDRDTVWRLLFLSLFFRFIVSPLAPAYFLGVTIREP